MCKIVAGVSKELRFFDRSFSGPYDETIGFYLFVTDRGEIGQLVLPESFKLLPLYVLALMKSKALRGTLELACFTHFLTRADMTSDRWYCGF